MPFYVYKAKSHRQSVVEGSIFLEENESIYKALKEKKLSLISYKKPISRAFFISKSAIFYQLKEWFYFLSQMLSKGMPLLESLMILRKQTKKVYFNKIISQIISQIEHGHSLSHALAAHTKIFTPLIIQTIKTYEKIGDLSLAFQTLYEHINAEITFKEKLYNALRYPLFIFLFFIGIFIYLNQSFIPQMIDFLSSNNIKAQELESFVFFQHHVETFSYSLLYSALTITIGMFLMNKFFPELYKRITFIIYKLPLVRFGINIQITRFFQTIGIMIKSGIDLKSAIDKAQDELRFNVLKNDFLEAKENIIKGEKISSAFNQKKIVDPIIIRFLEIGEHSEKLADNILLYTKINMNKMEQKLDRLTQYLQPALILVIGIIILCVLKIVLLPIYSYLPEISG